MTGGELSGRGIGKMSKVYVLFNGYGNVEAVFRTKNGVCTYMRREYPDAKRTNLNHPSELYWESDCGLWWRADEVEFLEKKAKK